VPVAGSGAGSAARVRPPLFVASDEVPMGVRPATDADRELVRGWRNHPQVRQASLTTHEIGPAEHARWWSAALSRPDRRIVIYLHDGVPAGVVIFDLDGQDGAT